MLWLLRLLRGGTATGTGTSALRGLSTSCPGGALKALDLVGKPLELSLGLLIGHHGGLSLGVGFGLEHLGFLGPWCASP